MNVIRVSVISLNIISQYRGLPRQVYLISVVRAIMAMGTFVFTFLSLMVTSQLGFDEFQAGNVMLLLAASNLLGSLLGGKLADVFGRKKMFLIADFFAVVAMMIAGFYCKSLPAIILVIFSFGFNSMTAPIAAAMITDYSQEENRAECFSLMYLSQNLGFAIGPTIGGLLFYNYTEWAFWGQAILYALGGLCMFLWIRDIYIVPDRTRSAVKAKHTVVEAGAGGNADGCDEPQGAGFGVVALQTSGPVRSKQFGSERFGSDDSLLSILLRIPILFAFVLCLIALTVCYQEISFMMPLHLSDMCGVENGSLYSGLIWTVNGLTIVFGTPIIISISKNRNQLANIAFAALLYAVGFWINSIASSVGVIFMAVVIWTAGEILISTGSGVFIAGYAPETHRGRFQSLYEVARACGRGIGPNIFGFYLLTHTFSQAWQVVSLVCIAAAGLVTSLYFVEKKSRDRSYQLQEGCNADLNQ